MVKRLGSSRTWFQLLVRATFLCHNMAEAPYLGKEHRRDQEGKDKR
jgi:hypothetical protein